MKIKNVILTAGLAMAMPLAAMAGSDNKAEDISKALNLDENRAEQVEQIMENYYEQHKQLKQQKEDQLDAILTDDEMDRLMKMKKDMKHDEKHDRKYD